MGAISRAKSRERRKVRVRKKVRGTPDKPRLSVFRSAKHIYAQLIDDVAGITIVDASSISKNFSTQGSGTGGNKEGAALVGESIAKKALEKGITKVVFDRNGFLYHGRVKALAESARENGLVF